MIARYLIGHVHHVYPCIYTTDSLAWTYQLLPSVIQQPLNDLFTSEDVQVRSLQCYHCHLQDCRRPPRPSRYLPTERPLSGHSPSHSSLSRRSTRMFRCSDATRFALTIRIAGQRQSQCRALFPHMASRICGCQICHPHLCGLSHDARVLRFGHSRRCRRSLEMALHRAPLAAANHHLWPICRRLY